MTTRSTTKIATVLGFPEYIPSTPPKKYKKLTWSGTSEQTSFALDAGDQISDAIYVYSGTSEIDTHGAFISKYRKDYYTPCVDSNFSPAVTPPADTVIPQLKGYCWETDPLSCPTCVYPPEFQSDQSGNNIHDEPFGLLGVGTGFHTLTATTLTNISHQGVVIAIETSGPGAATGVPQTVQNGVLACWLNLSADHNYQAVLTDEYTDAEALANALTVVSNGATAENQPRTTGFVSRFTTVTFALNLSNLISGKSYVITVQFRNQSFVVTTKTYTLTATASTAVINDSVPTPVAGGTMTVYSPAINFAP